MQHLVDGHAKAARIGIQRGHVAKQDTIAGEIDDGADIVFYRFLAARHVCLFVANAVRVSGDQAIEGKR